jgi:hypothetical protein
LNPWADTIPETLVVNTLQADTPNIDFKAIKIGDLSGDATPSIGILHDLESEFWATVQKTLDCFIGSKSCK